MAFVVRKRETSLGRSALLIYLGALAVALALCAGLLALSGKPALGGLAVLFRGAFGQPQAWLDGLVKAIPIFMCALGVALSFQMQIWNIGAEGQYALGAIGATWAALTFPGLPAYLLLPLMFCCAFVLGGIWGLIPAILRLRLGVNEIISSLMLCYIGSLAVQYLVYGVWRDPASFGFPMTRQFSDSGLIDPMGPTLGLSLGHLHWGVLACPIAGVAYWLFLAHTRLGFELTACGAGERVARYAGLPYGLLTALVLGVGGGLAGVAGCIETSANLGRLQPTVMVGYGFTAIVVAWLARLRPLPIAFASFLLAALRVGVEVMQLELQISAAFGQIIEGSILLCVIAGQFFLDHRIVWRGKTAEGAAAKPVAGEAGS